MRERKYTSQLLVDLYTFQDQSTISVGRFLISETQGNSPSLFYAVEVPDRKFSSPKSNVRLELKDLGFVLKLALSADTPPTGGISRWLGD